jgi:hypothetical protein
MNTQVTNPVNFLNHAFFKCLLFIFATCSLQNVLAGNKNVVFQPIFDAKTNMVMAQIPLPSGWKIIKKTNPEQAGIVGPNGIKIYDFAGKMFTYSNDPYMQQIYQQSGQPMRRPPGIEGLIKEDLVPLAQENGLQYVRHYLLPELAAKDREYSARLYKSMPSQDSFKVLATEWKNGDGSPALLILHYRENLGQGTLFWSYYGNFLEAPAAQFKQAKKDLIYGLLNTRHNPKQIQAFNQMEAQKAQNSNAAHQRKMQNNQANFEASQRAITSSNDAVNKSIMDGWKNSNAASDRSHDRYMNTVREENTVYDAGSGQSYQVESGSNQYWMNNGGEYIPSNDTLYNPNMDPNVNQSDWQEAEIYE